MTYYQLDDRAVFSLTGPEAERYLSGQVTQDLKQLETGGGALPACVCNAKGKMQGFGHLRRTPEGFLIDAPLVLRESLLQRLDRYLIADDAELLDRSDELKVVYAEGEPQAGFTPVRRFGVDGFDAIVPVAALAELSPLVEGHDFEAQRIDRGVPAWGAELNEETLPPEAGLEGEAISYFKGCYVGQEVISRMKSAGKVRRRLMRLDCEQRLDPGTELFDDAGKAAGFISSSASLEGRPVHLGYILSKAEASAPWRTGAGLLVEPRG